MAEMMKGNEAIAEAAVRAGVKFYAGYPITPSSEIMEYLSWRLPEVGGSFVQAESELAGINMVIGAAANQECSLVVCPTIASTDAPTSAMSILCRLWRINS